jgi:hypothetical protein
MLGSSIQTALRCSAIPSEHRVDGFNELSIIQPVMGLKKVNISQTCPVNFAVGLCNDFSHPYSTLPHFARQTTRSIDPLTDRLE